MEEISFNDFKKLDIRIGTVESVEKIKGTDKLLKFVFDFGSEKRQIVAGMAEFFEDINSLVGKQMPILMNIETATFCGHESQGMILAADVEHKPVLLFPEKEIPSGSKVR
jgi:methionine--tRNA ligase beta chain